MVQICLRDAQNLARFMHEMRSIASSENMRFIDSSADTKANLDVIDREQVAHEFDGPVISMAVERGDGMRVGASNLSLPGYQVALGFSEGRNAEEARRFAARVVRRLAVHWRVEPVPDGKGAKPLPNCTSSAGHAPAH